MRRAHKETLENCRTNQLEKSDSKTLRHHHDNSKDKSIENIVTKNLNFVSTITSEVNNWKQAAKCYDGTTKILKTNMVIKFRYILPIFTTIHLVGLH